MIKLITKDNQEKLQRHFPRLLTLKRYGGIFLAISKSQILCIDKGESGWKAGEFDVQENFTFSNDGFIDYNEPITIQNQ